MKKKSYNKSLWVVVAAFFTGISMINDKELKIFFLTACAIIFIPILLVSTWRNGIWYQTFMERWEYKKQQRKYIGETIKNIFTRPKRKPPID
jgi:hypothetical protein